MDIYFFVNETMQSDTTVIFIAAISFKKKKVRSRNITLIVK